MSDFPDGTLPENKLPKIASSCSTGTRPHAMTGFLVQLLRGHFCDSNNIEDPRIRAKLERAVWKPSADSGIVIDSHTKWSPTTSGKRPAILIRRNAWQWNRLAIGDSEGTDYRSGHEFYFGSWSGSSTIFALARDGGEVELLATEVARFLLHFGPVIVDQMDLQRFLLVTVGESAEVEESAEHYAVPIVVAYAAEESWEIQPSAPRLKKFVFRTSELF